MTKAKTLVSSIEPDLVQIKDAVALDALQDAVREGRYAFLHSFPNVGVDPLYYGQNYTIFTDDGVWLVGKRYEHHHHSVMVTAAEAKVPSTREEAQELIGRDQAALDRIEMTDPEVMLGLRKPRALVLERQYGPQFPEDWR